MYAPADHVCIIKGVMGHAIILAYIVDSIADAGQKVALWLVTIDGERVPLQVIGLVLQAILRRVA